MEIGSILKYQNFTDLSCSDLSSGWSVSGGKLVSPADVTKPLQFSYVSALWKWKKTIVSNKKSLKLYSYMTALNFHGEFYINSENKLCSYFSYSNTTFISTQSIGFNNGDLLEFSLNKNAWNLTFSVKNLTTNQLVSLDAKNVVHASHKLRLITSEVTEILSYKLESVQNQGGTIVVSDSIGYGDAATTEVKGWVRIANFGTEAGPGDRSADAVLLLPEIINHIKPERVVFAMGTNDHNIDVWKINIMHFSNAVRSKKITFIPCTPYANNVRSMAPFSDFIKNKFDVYFDLFLQTKQTNSTNLKNEYNSGDGIHPNNQAHLDIGNYILSNPYYQFFKNFDSFLIKMYHTLIRN